MQKNWYIIYTKPKCEKKVTSILIKRKIEYFFPLNWKETVSIRKRKMHQEPLFKSYIFVHVEESDIERLKSINGVLNLLYWKGTPAIINKEEIRVIKEFIDAFQDIRIEKYCVNAAEKSQSIDDFRYSLSGNVLIIKNSVVKANLPSLGFSIIAKVERDNSLISNFGFVDNTYEMQL